MKCKVCGIEFEKKCHNQKYCVNCRYKVMKAYNRYKSELRNKKNFKRNYDSLEMKCKEINKYNEIHGTNYTYGQYTALKRLNKI